MKSGSTLTFVFLFLFVALMATTGLLYLQNRFYKQQNRELIIQNDSILSANLELKRSMQTTGSKQVSQQQEGGSRIN